MERLYDICHQISVRNYQIKKYPKTDAKTCSISSFSVFSVPLWLVYSDNLFFGSLL
jgi:hypothetical protein